jgi:hypothetical protein
MTYWLRASQFRKSAWHEPSELDIEPRNWSGRDYSKHVCRGSGTYFALRDALFLATGAVSPVETGLIS